MQFPVAVGASRAYPRNTWWAAARSSELSSQPTSRWLLDRRVVLYRGDHQTTFALADRCPHRWSPLSDGRVEGNEIVCPYHGVRFNGQGICTRIPTQDKIPSRMRVDAFPVREHAGLVWIWLGDATRLSDHEVPSMPFFDDPAFMQVGGYMEVACNYMLLQENVMDLTHFSHLHADTLQQTGWESLPTVTPSGDLVRYEQSFVDLALAPFQAIPMGLPVGTRANRVDWGMFCSPACHLAGIDVVVPDRDSGTKKEFHVRIAHCVTPITANRSHYWWSVAQDYGQHNPDVRAGLVSVIEATFKQDKDVLEHTQETLDRDMSMSGAQEISLEADQAGLRVRRVLERLLTEEAIP